MKTLLLSLAASAALITTVPAAAAADDSAQISVRYDDLNLASAKGQKILERRLIAAARQACGLDGSKTGTRMRSEEETQCYRQAKATAMQRHAMIVEPYRLGG